MYFYSRPCGRGDLTIRFDKTFLPKFLLTPLREGRRSSCAAPFPPAPDFYSRPCGRGDCTSVSFAPSTVTSFLLTPLREGRPRSAGTYPRPAGFLLTPLREGRLTDREGTEHQVLSISTHAPAGGATEAASGIHRFLRYFYSRPCGRGDCNFPQVRHEVLRQIAER